MPGGTYPAGYTLPLALSTTLSVGCVQLFIPGSSVLGNIHYPRCPRENWEKVGFRERERERERYFSVRCQIFGIVVETIVGVSAHNNLKSIQFSRPFKSTAIISYQSMPTNLSCTIISRFASKELQKQMWVTLRSRRHMSM